MSKSVDSLRLMAGRTYLLRLHDMITRKTEQQHD